MVRAAVVIVLVLALNAQQPAGRSEFEVVSVKLGDPDSPASSYQMTPVGVQMRNVTLKSLVQEAYQTE